MNSLLFLLLSITLVATVIGAPYFGGFGGGFGHHHHHHFFGPGGGFGGHGFGLNILFEEFNDIQWVFSDNPPDISFEVSMWFYEICDYTWKAVGDGKSQV
ncbi:unnamed protein product, partial [Mesorhabditis belari]|uniref:Uncharacterized protein n=1 Tax=Mesorhabditis belari TaxID=2138241 RepID=A0AAF3J441_9BILA